MQPRIKDELRTIFSGKSEVRFGATIQSIARYLSDGPPTGAFSKGTKRFKEQETEKLIAYVGENRLWIHVDLTQYVSEGAEQKVYLKNSEQVLKLNDAIYYTSWTDYLHNLLLHNYFFPDSA